jgi:hypothetical protein
MFEQSQLKPPLIEVLGDLSEASVRKAHALLEEGHVKGKLVMKIASN